MTVGTLVHTAMKKLATVQVRAKRFKAVPPRFGLVEQGCEVSLRVRRCCGSRYYNFSHLENERTPLDVAQNRPQAKETHTISPRSVS